MALPLLGVYWSHMSIDEQMIKIDRPLPRFFHQKTEAKNKTFEETSTFTPVTTKKNLLFWWNLSIYLTRFELFVHSKTELSKVFEGRAAWHIFWALAGRTILIKCLDNFYPKYRSCEALYCATKSDNRFSNKS